MYKDCQVTDEGDVYEIQEDGSISKIGTIHELPEPKEEGTSALIIFLWIFLIVAIVAAVALGLRYKKANEDVKKYENLYSDARYDSENMENRYDQIQNDLRETQSELQNIKSSLSAFPMLVSRIELAGTDVYDNIINSYGSTWFYTSDIAGIYVRLKYVGIQQGNVSLQIRMFKGDDQWEYYRNVYAYRGENIADNVLYLDYDATYGWPCDNYRVEVWNGNICLGLTNFTVY